MTPKSEPQLSPTLGERLLQGSTRTRILTQDDLDLLATQVGTDLANGQFFAERFKDDLAYSPERQEWLVWNEDERRWQWHKPESVVGLYARRFVAEQLRDSDAYRNEVADLNEMSLDELRRFAADRGIELVLPPGRERLTKQTAIPQILAATADDESLRGSRAAYIAISLTDRRARRRMIEEAGELLVIDPRLCDADDELLGVKNGVVDLRDGAHHSHPRRDWYITKQAGVAYDKDATCPRWQQFIDFVTCGDKDTARYLQKLAGLSLWGRAEVQHFWVLEGIGANGKSTFVGTLLGVLGDYGTVASIETFLVRNGSPIRNDIAALQGARLVVSSEPDEKARFNVELLKNVTGGLPIKGRFLYREEFAFRPQFTLIMDVNAAPAIGDTSKGIWRRARKIAFNAQVPAGQQVEGYAEKLVSEEGPGILNWALEGFRLFKEEGMSEPEAVQLATAEYRATEDVIARFVDECVVITGDERDTVAKKSLFQAFTHWLNEEGEGHWTHKRFTQRFKAHAFEKGYRINGEVRDSRVRRWQGLKLITGPHTAPF